MLDGAVTGKGAGNAQSGWSARLAARPLFMCGFRPFFSSPRSMRCWCCSPGRLPRLRPGVAGGRGRPLRVHAHELMFGFGLAAVAGFVLTAVPEFTATPAFPPRVVRCVWYCCGWQRAASGCRAGSPPSRRAGSAGRRAGRCAMDRHLPAALLEIGFACALLAAVAPRLWRDPSVATSAFSGAWRRWRWRWRVSTSMCCAASTRCAGCWWAGRDDDAGGGGDEPDLDARHERRARRRARAPPARAYVAPGRGGRAGTAFLPRAAAAQPGDRGDRGPADTVAEYLCRARRSPVGWGWARRRRCSTCSTTGTSGAPCSRAGPSCSMRLYWLLALGYLLLGLARLGAPLAPSAGTTCWRSARWACPSWRCSASPGARTPATRSTSVRGWGRRRSRSCSRPCCARRRPARHARIRLRLLATLAWITAFALAAWRLGVLFVAARVDGGAGCEEYHAPQAPRPSRPDAGTGLR